MKVSYTELVWKDEDTSMSLLKIYGTKEHKYKYALRVVESVRAISDSTSKLLELWKDETTTIYNIRTGLAKLCKRYANVEKELQRVRDAGVTLSLETEMLIAKERVNGNR